MLGVAFGEAAADGESVADGAVTGAHTIGAFNVEDPSDADADGEAEGDTEGVAVPDGDGSGVADDGAAVLMAGAALSTVAAVGTSCWLYGSMAMLAAAPPASTADAATAAMLLRRIPCTECPAACGRGRPGGPEKAKVPLVLAFAAVRWRVPSGDHGRDGTER